MRFPLGQLILNIGPLPACTTLMISYQQLYKSKYALSEEEKNNCILTKLNPFCPPPPHTIVAPQPTPPTHPRGVISNIYFYWARCFDISLFEIPSIFSFMY